MQLWLPFDALVMLGHLCYHLTLDNNFLSQSTSPGRDFITTHFEILGKLLPSISFFTLYCSKLEFYVDSMSWKVLPL